MDSLERALIKTIAYFDIFDFAPTLLEIEKWLLKCDVASPALNDIQCALESQTHIQQQEGFYFFAGREQLVNIRKQKYTFTDQKWKRARPFIRLLAMMPGVEGVWLANSVAWGNARKSSDTDLVIIAMPGRIWTARFWTTALMKLLHQRPGEQTEDKALCLSCYISSDALNLQQYKIGDHDIHFAFWAAQFYPLYDTGAYEQYKKQNTWLDDVFQRLEWTTPIPQRSITVGRTAQFVKTMLNSMSLESLLKKIQLRILPRQLRELSHAGDNRVVINDDILKLHGNDNRAERQRAWEQKVHTLLT